MLIKIFTILLLLTSVSQAYFRNSYNKTLVEKDIKAGNVGKYRVDKLPFFTKQQLIDKKVFSKSQKLIRDYTGSSLSVASVIKLYTCQNLEKGYTGTIYDIDFKNGSVTCMFAPVGDLYNPIGLFKVEYPKLKKLLGKDLESALIKNEYQIQLADEKFKTLRDTKKDIAASINPGDTHLSIPTLLLSSILTDQDIINIEATNDTGKLQLEGSYSATITENGVTKNNGDMIKATAANIFNTYSALSQVSMQYLLILVGFFAIYGLSWLAITKTSEKAQKIRGENSHIYIFSLIAGILVFYPVNDHTNISNSNGDTVGQYQIMKTRYQNFEKAGYYLFNDWANSISKVIIDTEMDTLIDKSGIGNKDKIINTWSGKEQAKNIVHFNEIYVRFCEKSVFDTSLFKNSKGENIYSENQTTLFPHSESWAYAAALTTLGAREYYDPAPRGLVRYSGYNPSIITAVGADKLENYYPVASISSCGKSARKIVRFTKKLKDYEKAYVMAVGSQKGEDKKILILKNLVNFQYTLYREWGYLAVLGLPITKMQTEYLHGLYQTDDQLDEYNKEIGGNIIGEGVHSVLSSTSYMLIPGVGTIYRSIIGYFRDLKSDYKDTLVSKLGGLFGANIAIGSVANIMGFSLSTIIAKTLLLLAPVVVIIIIGLFRFIYGNL